MSVLSGRTLFVQLAGSGLTVADVREWLRRVDELEITDDMKLDLAQLRVTVKSKDTDGL